MPNALLFEVERTAERGEALLQAKRSKTGPKSYHIVQEATMHRVGAGQTLSRIAKLYGGHWLELAKWNNLADPNRLEVGQLLSIPRRPCCAADVVCGEVVGGLQVWWGDPLPNASDSVNAARKRVAEAFFTAWGVAAKSAGLEWGGDWQLFPDAAHVQLPLEEVWK